MNAGSPGPTKTARFQATRKIDTEMMETTDSLMRYADPEEAPTPSPSSPGPQAKFIHGEVLPRRRRPHPVPGLTR